MEPFSYKGECGITHIETFKRSWATYKLLRVISNTLSFITVITMIN